VDKFVVNGDTRRFAQSKVSSERSFFSAGVPSAIDPLEAFPEDSFFVLVPTPSRQKRQQFPSIFDKW